MALKTSFLLLIFLSLTFHSNAQEGITRFDQFHLKDGELIWQNVYSYTGSQDSVRHAVVQMLKSKLFTFNVIRNEEGYNGELRHYKVDCKKYGRTYLNTPRMYWDGEWTGKFTVEVAQNSYRVTVYALYFEKMEQSTGYYRTEKPVKGKYLDAVTVKNKKSFRKNELNDMALMSQSLREDFDIKNTVLVKED